jgi:iron complex outermembrane receptor protein
MKIICINCGTTGEIAKMTMNRGRTVAATPFGQRLTTKTSIAALLVGLVLQVPGAAYAQQSSTLSADQKAITFAIPVQDLNQALLTFTQQANLQVFYNVSRVQGLENTALNGPFTPDQALKILLSGTGMTYQFTGKDRVSIQKIDNTDTTGTQIDPIYIEATNAHASNDGLATGYVATMSSSATKTGTPLIETAKSVSVVTRKELDDRASANLEDAVSYSAGVTTNNYGYDPRFDQVYVRGYPVHIYGDYRDGLRQMTGDYATFRTEPYDLEQVEIVKGPTAVLYGQSTPGGILNSVTKRPREGTKNEVYGRYTDTESYEGGFDLGTKVNKDGKWLSRFVGMGRTGETSNDIQDDRLMFAPSIRWQPNDNTDLTIYLQAQKDETDASATLLNVNGNIVDYRTSDPDYDYQKQTQLQLGYDISHKIDDTPFTLNQKTRFGYFDLEARYLTGSVTGGGWRNNNAEYWRGAQAAAERLWSIQLDNQVVSEFETGATDHTLLTGVDYIYSKSDYRFGTGVADSAFTFYLNNPGYGVSGPTPAYTQRDDIEYSQVGTYLQDQLKVDNWHISLGARLDYAEYSRQSRVSDSGSSEYHTKPTYNVGVLYAFDMGLSPYVNWATSFLPSKNKNASNDILPPSEGEQYEAGVKYQPTGYDSFVTVSAYRLVEENVARYAGYSATIGSYYEAIGKVESRGAEIEGNFNLGHGLNLTTSYTFNHAKIVKGTNRGNTPTLTPETTASGWIDYALPEGPLKGVSFGVGGRYVGSSYSSMANTSKNDSYGVVDAAVRYNFAALDDQLAGLSLAINGTNIADNKAGVCNNGYCYQIEGRTVTATVKYAW